jgi:hypothetical protein
MGDPFWLTAAQMARPEPCFPKFHGKPRVNDRRMKSRMISFNSNGLLAAPKVSRPQNCARGAIVLPWLSIQSLKIRPRRPQTAPIQMWPRTRAPAIRLQQFDIVSSAVALYI